MLAGLIVLAIWELTKQDPNTTLSESTALNDFFVSQFGNSSFYDPSEKLWFGVHIRHWAHTAEFFCLGIFATMSVWFSTKPRVGITGIISLAICVLFSLLDQCHKLFVPGRHFDGFDLVMDALGYGIAIVIAITIATLLKRKTMKETSVPKASQ